MKIRDFIKNILPPFVFNLIKKCFDRKYGWHGDYPSWEAAQAHCKGYDSDEIIKKVRDSLLKVKNGEAVYERDSVIFDEIQYSWQVLSGLMWVAAQNNGKLNVLDFGGSLGSSYFQNKAFLDKLSDVKWNIIEQEKFVNIGKVDFENESLRFYLTIKDCIKDNKPNVILLSNVLQYLEKPYKQLTELFSYNVDSIILDVVFLAEQGNDMISIQTVPPYIYEAAYPCHIFSKKNFRTFIDKFDYKVIVEYYSYIGQNFFINNKILFNSYGFILSKFGNSGNEKNF